MKTYSPKPEHIERRWYVVDASGVVLGRLASEVATILRGKHKPMYAPHMDTGDHVVVVNADKIELTGNKGEDKYAYRHSGFPGAQEAARRARRRAPAPGAIAGRAGARRAPGMGRFAREAGAGGREAEVEAQGVVGEAEGGGREAQGQERGEIEGDRSQADGEEHGEGHRQEAGGKEEDGHRGVGTWSQSHRSSRQVAARAPLLASGSRPVTADSP